MTPETYTLGQQNFAIFNNIASTCDNSEDGTYNYKRPEQHIKRKDINSQKPELKILHQTDKNS